MPHKGQGLISFKANTPTGDESRLNDQSAAFGAAASQINPQDPFTAILKGVVQGIGLNKGIQAGEAKSARLDKIQEMIAEHENLAENIEHLENKAIALQGQEAAIGRVGTSVASAYINFTNTGNLEELRGNLSAPAEEILRKQGTSLASLAFADGNPSQIIITGKDGSVTQISAFQISDVVRKSNPELADAMLASLGGFNRFRATAQLKADAAAAFGADPDQAARIELGVEKPVDRQETGGVGAFKEGFQEPQNAVKVQFQKKLVSSEDLRVRLKAISDTFKPEFLTFGGQFKGLALRFLDKVSPDLLKVVEEAGVEKPAEFLREQAAFVQNVNANANLYIKEITGAQMSEAEASRLLLAVPNRDDTGTVFKAKLDNLNNITAAVSVRTQFALKHGISLTAEGSLDVNDLAQQIAIPITEEDFNRIPSGARFVNPATGTILRKK